MHGDNCEDRTPSVRHHTITPGKHPLAKTNYSFEKRQREIAKKKKQDNKQAKKLASRDDARVESSGKVSTGKDR